MPALHLSAEGSWGAMRSSLAEGLSVLMAGTERGVVSCVSPHGERVAHLIVGSGRRLGDSGLAVSNIT